jgi:hypothetical protein
MRAYLDAWKSFYSFDHIETIFRRRRGEGHSVGKLLGQMIWFCGAVFVEGVHPLQAGILRRKHRSERRPTLPRISFIPFVWKRTREILDVLARGAWLIFKLWRISRKVRGKGSTIPFLDMAINPVPAEPTPVFLLSHSKK